MSDNPKADDSVSKVDKAVDEKGGDAGLKALHDEVVQFRKDWGDSSAMQNSFQSGVAEDLKTDKHLPELALSFGKSELGDGTPLNEQKMRELEQRARGSSFSNNGDPIEQVLVGELRKQYDELKQSHPDGNVPVSELNQRLEKAARDRTDSQADTALALAKGKDGADLYRTIETWKQHDPGRADGKLSRDDLSQFLDYVHKNPNSVEAKSLDMTPDKNGKTQLDKLDNLKANWDDPAMQNLRNGKSNFEWNELSKHFGLTDTAEANWADQLQAKRAEADKAAQPAQAPEAPPVQQAADRGRTPSEANGDVQNLFAGDKGKTLYDRLSNGKDYFTAEDVSNLQKTPPADLTADQKKYLDSLTGDAVKQMDRTHDGKITAGELQEPLLGANEKPKSAEELRQGQVNQQELKVRRDFLDHIATDPQKFDASLDANGNIKPEALKAVADAIAARPDQPEAVKQYGKYLADMAAKGPVNPDELARDAGYADFRSFQVGHHTVKPSEQDKKDLATFLSDPKNADIVKQLTDSNGNITEATIKSFNNSLTPESGSQYTPEQLKALSTLDASFNRLSDNGQIKPEEYAKKIQQADADARAKEQASQTVLEQAQQKLGEGPYQAAARLLGEGASHKDIMALTGILQQQYGKDTGDNPRNPTKLKVGHHWISNENMSEVMERIARSGNPALTARFKALLPQETSA